MSGIFDSHAHYDDEAFNEDREELLKALPDNGIEYVVNVGASFDSCHKTLELAHKYDYIYGALGIHPCDIGGVSEADYEWIRSTAESDNKIVAIGEIGLDYYWEKENAPNQKIHFEKQLQLAMDIGKPAIIHSREAAKDTYELMKSMNAERCGGVVHCFSYHKEEARKYLDMGYYIGIGGASTFKNNSKTREVIEYTPMDRILLETDCPYLAPVPHRGKRNSSLNLPIVTGLIAEIKKIDCDEVIRVTCDNAKRMYGIK